MARDVNLILAAAGTPITATGNGTAVDTEGGFFAVVRIQGGTITDANETFACIVEASIDNGGNYYPIGAFPTLLAANDDVRITRPVWVPTVDFAGGETVTKVRLAWTVAGSTPSNAIDAFLEPLTSLGAPQVDVDLAEGLESIF